MKKITLIILLFSLSNSTFSQLAAMIEKKASKSAFSKALKAIEEKDNRFFLKTGNEKYIGASVGEEEFLMEDNNMYADVALNEDILTFVIHRYNPYKKEFTICETYHGSNDQNLENTKFRKLDGDVYVRLEDITNLTRLHEYVLYNTNKGLYFHYNIFEDQNGREASGGGFYKKTKDEKTASEDIKKEESRFKEYNQMYELSINAFEVKQKQLAVKQILAKADEGIISPFQKQNLGKLLFGNAVTEQNKFIATSYKTKFSIDEPIKVAVFLDKGFGKYIDTTESIIKENLEELLGVKHSKFKIKLTVNNSETKTFEIYIENKAPYNKTSGVFNLVLKNAKTGNNQWLHSFFPDKVESKEYKIKVDLLSNEKAEVVIATGEYIYTPKVGAKLPHGYSCSLAKDIENPKLMNMKPRLKEIAEYSIAKFNKKENRNYTFVNLSIVSDWITEKKEYGSDNIFIYVEFLCKDSKGEEFIFTDRFIGLDKSDIGFFDAILYSKFNVNLCDK